MKNLPHLIVERGSHVRRVAEILGEICKIDSQIAEQRVGISDEDSAALDAEIDAQDDKLINALTVAENL